LAWFGIRVTWLVLTLDLAAPGLAFRTLAVVSRFANSGIGVARAAFDRPCQSACQLVAASFE